MEKAKLDITFISNPEHPEIKHMHTKNITYDYITS